MTRPRLESVINWKYAVGEFVLIFAGIVAALAAADWNDDRLARADERTILREMRASLETDLEELRPALSSLLLAESRAQRLLRHIRSGAPYTAAVDTLLGGVYGVILSEVNGAPYDVLRSRGLSLVRDDALRLQIMEVYDRAYERLEGSEDVLININDLLDRPYFLENFRSVRPNVSATPIDYDRLLATPFFENLVDYRITSLRGSSIEAPEGAVAAAQGLSEAITDYLGDGP